MKWFKFFAIKRNFSVLRPIEVFFKMHSWATERKKGKKWVQKTNFLANGKSLNTSTTNKIYLKFIKQKWQLKNPNYIAHFGQVVTS